MSFGNFKPEVWANEIMTQLARRCVFAGITNMQYEGDVKDKGDSVRIRSAARPTISTQTETNFTFDEPEEVPTSDTVMYINQIRSFNYMIGNIDQAQSTGGLKEALSTETTNALAEEIDSYIASFALSTDAKKVNASPVLVDSTNVFKQIDLAWQMLMENNVPSNETINMVVSPRFWVVLREQYMKLDTDNSKLIKTGQMAKYSNINIIMSNAVAKTQNGAVDNIMVMTEKALAYVNPFTKTVAYEPEKKLADAIKGATLFDAKIIRPKELAVLNVKYA